MKRKYGGTLYFTEYWATMVAKAYIWQKLGVKIRSNFPKVKDVLETKESVVVTFKDEDSNFQQFNISKILDSKENGGAAFINIHGGTVKGYDLNSENINVEKVYNKMGVAKFAILPNLGTTDEKWKYTINIVTNLSTEKLLLTNLNFETSNGLDMYRTMYNGKIK